MLQSYLLAVALQTTNRGTHTHLHTHTHTHTCTHAHTHTHKHKHKHTYAHTTHLTHAQSDTYVLNNHLRFKIKYHPVDTDGELLSCFPAVSQLIKRQGGKPQEEIMSVLRCTHMVNCMYIELDTSTKM